jgi:hypothetical protein
LVGRDSDGTGEITEVVFDLAEGLALGEIDEVLGHLAQRGVGLAAEGVQQGLNARLTVIGGL